MTPSYILIGPPGSGKSTLASCIVERLGLVHIEIGSELRQAARENTPFAEEINQTINHKRELVSDMVVYGVLAQALMRVPEGQGVMLDGAPRPASQIDEVLHILSMSGREVAKVVFIQLPESESIRRISKRFKCEACAENLVLGETLAAATAPCPRCGGRVSQRQDDTIEGVKKRYAIFQNTILPTVEHFRKAGLLIEVDGTVSATALCDTVEAALREGH